MKISTFFKTAMITSFLLGGHLSQSFGQCTSCTASYGEGSSGTTDLNGNQTICITGNSTLGINNVNGSGNKICIAPGATWTPTGGQSNYSDLVFDVYGTFKTSQLAGNGNITLNVHDGGKLEFSGSSVPRQYTINNSGTVEFTANGNIEVQANLDNATATSRVIARGGDNSLLKFHEALITNKGIIDATHLENSHTKPFLNEGQVFIQGVFYQHGALTNRGTIETQCGVTSGAAGFPSCQFIVGDKSTTDFQLKTGSVIKVTGPAQINGQVNYDGGILIVNGQLDINKPVTGTDGTLIVTPGNEANINTGGSFGNNDPEHPMTFYSEDPDGNPKGFDSVPPGHTSLYIVPTVNPLPVHLTKFNVLLEGQLVNISWETTSEVNSEKFEIERSLNAKNWTKIGTVNVQGQNEKGSQYQFSDNLAGAKMVYYRLKMIDLDGTFAFSTIKSIYTEKGAQPATYVFPNPASDKLFISEENTSGVKNVFIYNLNGKIALNPGKINGNEVNIQALPAGKYMVRVIYNDKSMQVTQILVVR